MKKEIKITILAAVIIILTTATAIFMINKKEDSNDREINTDSDSTHVVDTIEDEIDITFARIDADVLGSDTASYPTTELIKYDFSTDDAKNYATILFDNSEYKYERLFFGATSSESALAIETLSDEKKQLMENPPEHMTSEDIDNQIAYIDESIQFHRDLIESSSADTDLTDDPQYLPSISDSSESIDPDSTDVSKHCAFSGTYNNLPYLLGFTKHMITESTSMSFTLADNSTPVWGEYTLDQLSLETMFSEYNNMTTSDDNNLCTYSKEDAALLCNNMINSLNITDMAIINIVPIETSVIKYENDVQIIADRGTCGYCIVYGKKTNDISLNYSSYQLQTSGDFFDGEYCDLKTLTRGPETLIFRVMDCGIISMNYDLPTIIDSVSTDSTPLLSFDVIMSVFQSEMQKDYGNIKFYKTPANNIVISKIKLGLARVTTDAKEGTYTLIPVWDFYIDDYKNVGITINAIDGSRIDPYTGYISE